MSIIATESHCLLLTFHDPLLHSSVMRLASAQSLDAWLLVLLVLCMYFLHMLYTACVVCIIESLKFLQCVSIVTFQHFVAVLKGNDWRLFNICICYICCLLTLKVLVTTIDALGHF